MENQNSAKQNEQNISNQPSIVQTQAQSTPAQPAVPTMPTSVPSETTPPPASQGETLQAQKPKRIIPVVHILVAVIIGIITLIAIGLLYYSMQNKDADQITETVVSAPIPTPDPKANWKTYSNTAHGYSLRHPDNFSIVKGPAESLLDEEFQTVDHISFSGDSNTEDSNRGTSMSIQVNPQNRTGTQITCSSSKDCLSKYLLQTLTPSPENTISVDKTIDGENFTGINYETSNPLYTQNSTYIANYKNGDFILISFTLNNESNNELENNVNQILSTFKFTEQGEVQAASNWRTYNTRCSFSVNHPEGWNSTKYYINDTSNQCAYITHPEYLRGVDFRKGFYVHITRTKLGSEGGVKEKFPIYTLEDFIKNEENARDPVIPVRNVTEKEFGPYSGISYVGIGNDLERSFIFYNDVNIIKISWPIEYEREFSKDLELIIDSIKFNN